MSSQTQILYHIVIRTKKSTKSLNTEHDDELFKYIWGIIKNNKCFLYRINGVEDHIHILSDLHPTVSLSEYLRQIKASSSAWIKKSAKFPKFIGWSEGYAAFTCSYDDKTKIIDYIKGQKKHHEKITFKDEYRQLLLDNQITFDENFLL